MREMVVMGGIILASIVFAAMAVFCLMLYRQKENENSYVFLSDTATMGRSFGRKSDKPWALIYVNISLQSVRSHHSNAEAEEGYRFIQEALMSVAHRSPGGMIAKVDGKNYLLMLQEGPEAAEKMAMDIVGAIRKHSNGHGVVSVPDITFGYYQANIGQVRFEEACRRAKQTYKLAAANGKNWGTYRYETAHELDKVEGLEKTILQAIADDSFFLEFQPFIDAAQGTIVGGEVLSRLHDEREGLVMPRYFLQAVESSSCHSRFDYYIFEKTCKWAACQTNKELKYLSINFSRYSLSEPDFSQNIIQIADSYHIPHDILAVEITEEEQEKSHPNVCSNLNALHEAGFSIFLDDFGSGFTSLDDLQNYSIDVVKIDKKILNLTTSQKGRIVFSSVAAMARQLGCQVLCEGVETAEQLETAQAAECDLIQGFYYYHSLPAEEFSCLLGHRVEPTGATATMAEPELRTDQERLTALGIIDAGL